MNPAIEQRLRRAVDCHREGRLAEAEAAYRDLLREDPRQPDALHLLGVALTQAGRAAEGAESMGLSLTLNPDQPIVQANLGNALAALGKHEAALAAYEQALGALPDYAPGHNGRGNSLARLGRWQEAVASYRRALARNPDLVEAHTNLGLALFQLGQFDASLDSYDRALALSPRHLSALLGRGQILVERGRPAEALSALEAALQIQADHPTALFLQGRALMETGECATAAHCFRRVHELEPDYEYVQGARLWAELHVCEWGEHSALIAKIEDSVAHGHAAVFPFVFFSACDSPELQLRCTRQFADRHRTTGPPLWSGQRYRHERIRLAYVSADFRSHPTSYLMMGLWELHDRRRFETFAVSLGPEEDSAVGRRIKAAFEHFIDGSALGDAELAAKLRELEIDIVVDLMGYTGGTLRSLLPRRPAPIQVNYLGYPGSLGCADADYLIADEFLIPEAHTPHFSECVVRLPGCYQPNDCRRAIAGPTSRAEAGLPANAFVWGVFNNGYKLNPRLFDVWCSLLHAVPDSLLWTIPNAPQAETNLRKELAARHIEPARLIAARNVSNPEHLARIALADLCLDTAPVNGATTTSDALWAGVPVVTYAGRSFVSRMAGSILTGAGLPELVTSTCSEYEQLALALATDRPRLAAVRAKLKSLKSTCALFDTDRSRRHLEAAFTQMWERQQRGEPPCAFTVAQDAGA